MIRGLQITIRGEALTQRITERIRLHEATVGALDARIRQRDGDQSFDVRPEDGFKTLGELKDERQRWQDRVSQLMLLRDSLVGHELYALSRADLRLADLISSDVTDGAAISDERWGDDAKNVAVEGLKVTISGEEIRTLIEQRMHIHRERVEWWKGEQARTPEQQTEDEPLLPDQICENEAERHIWRADVLGFIRDHIEAASLYRLGEADLAFGELLPEKPGWMEQQEYEERTGVAFHLERLTKRVSEVMPLPREWYDHTQPSVAANDHPMS